MNLHAFNKLARIILSTLLWIFLLFFTQVFPDQYIIIGTVESINGSSSDGGCENSLDLRDIFNCQGERESVIFDAAVPNLTVSDFQGEDWARELLTIQTESSTFTLIVFQFLSTLVSVEAVEIVLFNCPQWGISIDTIRIQAGQDSILQDMRQLTSCDSLVSVCLPVNFTVNELEFVQRPGSDWIHLAEITIFERGSDASCQSAFQPSQPPGTSINS